MWTAKGAKLTSAPDKERHAIRSLGLLKNGPLLLLHAARLCGAAVCNSMIGSWRAVRFKVKRSAGHC